MPRIWSVSVVPKIFLLLPTKKEGRLHHPSFDSAGLWKTDLESTARYRALGCELATSREHHADFMAVLPIPPIILTKQEQSSLWRLDLPVARFLRLLASYSLLPLTPRIGIGLDNASYTLPLHEIARLFPVMN